MQQGAAGKLAFSETVSNSMLFGASVAIVAMFIAEAAFGLSWALGGEFRYLASLFAR